MAEPTPGSPEIGNAGAESAPRTGVFDVLTDEERCKAIEYLARETGTVSVDELVGFVEATSVSVGEPLDSWKRTQIRFHHIHLPKMDAAELIDYDQDDRTVTPTETLDAAFQFIGHETDTGNQ